jgi:hypothetical protein
MRRLTPSISMTTGEELMLRQGTLIARRPILPRRRVRGSLNFWNKVLFTWTFSRLM